MEISAVVERVRQVAAVRADDAIDPGSIEAALRATSQVRSWLASSEAALTARLAAHASFPEQTIAECARSSLNDAAKSKERSDTLGKVPPLADALDDAAITPGHVDAVTKATKGLDDDEQRDELLDRVAGLIDIASAATVEEFRRRLALEVKSIRRDDGMKRLERQQRAARLRTWVDGEGMWRFDGRFDPVTGIALAVRLDTSGPNLVRGGDTRHLPGRLDRETAPPPSAALARLVVDDTFGVGRPGRPEYVVVVDASQPDGSGGPLVDWGLPVDVPVQVLAGMWGSGDVHTVVVRNGVVLHAPGTVDLGRTTRLANRAQRRALRALYPRCAIPGCSVHYGRCKLHHVVWWRHGGRTDLANLIPVCTHHHTKVHHDGWALSLGSHRELTIRFPDGTVRNTGPPTRSVA